VLTVDLDATPEQVIARDWPAAYYEVQTSLDGSCFFAALADQLGLPMSDAHHLRLRLVEHIRLHHQKFVREILLALTIQQASGWN